MENIQTNGTKDHHIRGTYDQLRYTELTCDGSKLRKELQYDFTGSSRNELSGCIEQNTISDQYRTCIQIAKLDDNADDAATKTAAVDGIITENRVLVLSTNIAVGPASTMIMYCNLKKNESGATVLKSICNTFLYSQYIGLLPTVIVTDAASWNIKGLKLFKSMQPLFMDDAGDKPLNSEFLPLVCSNASVYQEDIFRKVLPHLLITHCINDWSHMLKAKDNATYSKDNYQVWIPSKNVFVKFDKVLFEKMLMKFEQDCGYHRAECLSWFTNINRTKNPSSKLDVMSAAENSSKKMQRFITGAVEFYQNMLNDININLSKEERDEITTFTTMIEGILIEMEIINRVWDLGNGWDVKREMELNLGHCINHFISSNSVEGTQVIKDIRSLARFFDHKSKLLHQHSLSDVEHGFGLVTLNNLKLVCHGKASWLKSLHLMCPGLQVTEKASNADNSEQIFNTTKHIAGTGNYTAKGARTAEQKYNEREMYDLYLYICHAMSKDTSRKQCAREVRATTSGNNGDANEKQTIYIKKTNDIKKTNADSSHVKNSSSGLINIMKTNHM